MKPLCWTLALAIAASAGLDFDLPLAGDRTLQLGPWPGYEVELALVGDKQQILCQVGPVGDGLASPPAEGGNEPARGFVRLPPRANAPARVCLGEAWDDNDIEVVLQALSQRRLVVRDAGGQPAPFAQVVIAHRFGTKNEYLFLHDRCVADRDGRVDLMSSASTWDIIAVTDNGMGWSRIEENDTRDEVPVALLPIGCARFRVVDGDGNPVPDARLADNPGWVDYPDDYLLRQVALHLALSRRSDHDGMLIVPMPYGEFRETRIVRGQQQTWRQTVRAGDEVKTVVMR